MIRSYDPWNSLYEDSLMRLSHDAFQKKWTGSQSYSFKWQLCRASGRGFRYCLPRRMCDIATWQRLMLDSALFSHSGLQNIAIAMVNLFVNLGRVRISAGNWSLAICLCTFEFFATPCRGAGDLFPIENEDPVSMQSVKEFESAPGDLVFTGKGPSDFLFAVREVLHDPKANLRLRVKKGEQDAPNSTVGLRLQACQLSTNKHWLVFLYSDWEVWVQILITMRQEPNTNTQLVTLRYAVGERQIGDAAGELTQIKSYQPAVDFVDRLKRELQSKFDSLGRR